MARDTLRILIVDDEPFILSAYSDLLGRAGHDVAACSEWTQVARAVNAHNPDVVLMDYHMPLLKGDQLVSVLRRHSVNPAMKIVLISSASEDELRRVAAECGADGYLSKDVAREQLVMTVRTIAGHPAV